MFPAYAGMIRYGSHSDTAFRSVPRLRGDDPRYSGYEVLDIRCSPPTRG